MTSPATISFRLVEPGDLAMLRGWLLRPHVARWWGTPDSLAALAKEFDARDDNPVRGYVAYEGLEPIGFAQSYVAARCHDDGWWLDEHDPGVIGIDQFLAEGDRLGQGLGTRMVQAFVGRLLADPAVTRNPGGPCPGQRPGDPVLREGGVPCLGRRGDPGWAGAPDVPGARD